MITSQLPPWITPTLPQTSPAPSTTLPPWIVPTLPETSGEQPQATAGAALVAPQR